MRVSLVAMPWSNKDRPSVAIGALSAYLRRERPEVEVHSRFEYLNIAARIGFSLYDAVVMYCWYMGDLVYMPQLYPEKREDVRRAFSEWAGNPENNMSLLSSPGEGGDWGNAFDGLQEILGRHLDEIVRRFPDASPEEIRRALDGFIEPCLMFREGESYLSLSMAASPEIVARRIRQRHDEGLQEAAARPRN